MLELTDYAERYLVDRFATLPGVAHGAPERRAPLRDARLARSREALAARQLTVADVGSALRRENVELPGRPARVAQREFTLRTDTGLRTEEDFRQLVIGRGPDGYLVRLGEVADVRLAAENERSVSRSNGSRGLTMAISRSRRRTCSKSRSA